MATEYGVGLIITNLKGEYLLHLRDDIQGIWSPGEWSLITGSYETKDKKSNRIKTIIETGKRELLEEIGLNLELKLFLIDKLKKTNQKRFILEAEYNNEISNLKVNEGEKIQFFQYNEISILKIHPSILYVIQKHHKHKQIQDIRHFEKKLINNTFN